MIELSLDEATERLRSDFRRFLTSTPPPKISSHAPLPEFVEKSRAWQSRLAAERFVGVHFPEEYGGRGLSLVQEAVLQEELAKVGAPQLVGMFGLTMVGPVLLRHGSASQKKRFLSKILSAEEIWCQGFSEPQAGSDLASVTTSATLRDEQWLLNGQKVWTSFAQFASFCFMLVRTDVSVAKHKGLSYLLVPMSTGGIEIRPLRQITGDAEFNELFLSDVSVPKENLVGAPGQGWEIAISTLMYERVILTFARHLQSEAALQDLARMVGASPSDRSYESLGRVSAQMDSVRALALSHLAEYSNGSAPGPEGSIDKLLWSETFQLIARESYQMQGVAATVFQDSNSEQLAHLYLYSRGRTIAAGTSEIQRSIVAERLVGLPRK